MRYAFHSGVITMTKWIIVVDDDTANLKIAGHILSKNNFRVTALKSGKTFLDYVESNGMPDLVLLDIKMPEMDGLQTLDALKKMTDNLSIDAPCIALTANAGAGAREEYVAAGFNDYLSKPVNGELLEEMLKNYLPKEKVLEADLKEEDGVPCEGVEDNTGELLNMLEGIDLEEAKKNCGSPELLRNVVKEFWTTIDMKADQIEKFAAERDYRNYTVNVHALKSSARLIGAMEISAMAARLEECGNNEDEKEILEKTPKLLELFRSYNEKLSAINGNTNENELPEIGKEELENAFSDMRELLEAYDFDTADGIMNMLAEYRIPVEFKEKYLKVKELMSAVDRDELLKVL